MSMEVSPLPIAVRAWAVPEPESHGSARKRVVEVPDLLLVFDSETRLDPAQSMTFAAARVYRQRQPFLISDPDRWECIGEYLVAGDSLTEAERTELQAYVARLPRVTYFGTAWDATIREFRREAIPLPVTEDGVPLVLLDRDAFLKDVFFPLVERAHALVVGFNLPFDLSRFAVGWSDARAPRGATGINPMAGGFSFVLTEHNQAEDRHRPRVAIKTIDSKRHLIQLHGGEQGSEGRFRGQFLDLRTLAFALSNEGHTLASAGAAFGAREVKLADHPPTGAVSCDEIEYARQDVRATFALFERLEVEFHRHPFAPVPGADASYVLQPTRAYSPASIGKAYLDAMGVVPPLERGWGLTAEFLGQTMSAFYGGRAECRIRRVPVPVACVDFTSMYPTVNGLMRLWDVVIVADLELVEDTAEVQAFLDAVTLQRAFDPAFWWDLLAFVELVPDGSILPVRADYEGTRSGYQIGVNPLTGSEPLWYALPDVVAATLLGGSAPRIRRAIRLVPSGQLGTLKPTILRETTPVDPRERDLFLAAIEERAKLDEHDPTRAFLKVFANATSYGIYAQTDRHELRHGQRVPVTVHSRGATWERADLPAVETPGRFAFPPMAALITAGARLMLALLERCVTDAGGTYAMVDTDSMAIVATRRGCLVPCPGGPHQSGGRDAVRALSWGAVEVIRRRFDQLNPYRSGTVSSILKVEAVNFEAGGAQRQLHAYAISAKRYALFELRGSEPQVVKASEHGLGHLLNPHAIGDRSWIAQAWATIIGEALGHPSNPLSFAARPAVTRLTISSPVLLRPFASWNRDKPVPGKIRPFNFVMSAHVAPYGHPPGVDPTRFHLVSRYATDPSLWLRQQWIDRYSGKSFHITTRDPGPASVRVLTVGEVLDEYRTHPEAKSLGADGLPCARNTVGLLARRPVTVGRIHYIGKEANELEDVDSGLVHDIDDVLTDYSPRDDPWLVERLPLIRSVPTGLLAAAAGVDRKTVQRTKSGLTRPHPRTQQRLYRAALVLGRREPPSE